MTEWQSMQPKILPNQAQYDEIGIYDRRLWLASRTRDIHQSDLLDYASHEMVVMKA